MIIVQLQIARFYMVKYAHMKQDIVGCYALVSNFLGMCVFLPKINKM